MKEIKRIIRDWSRLYSTFIINPTTVSPITEWRKNNRSFPIDGIQSETEILFIHVCKTFTSDKSDGVEGKGTSFSFIGDTFSRISNSFPRIRQLVLSNRNSFPRIGQLVLSDCNSFPRIRQSVLSNCNPFPRIGQLVLSDCNSFPRSRQCVIRGNDLQLERTYV